MATYVLNNFNGSDGSTTFTDEVVGITWSIVDGSPQLDTAEKKFGTASLLVPESSGYSQIKTGNLTFTESGNWTIEFFFRLGGSSYHRAGFYIREPADFFGCVEIQAIRSGGTVDDVLFYVRNSTNTANIVNFTHTNAVSASTWYHAAIVRDVSGGTYSCYFEGSRVHQVSSSADPYNFGALHCYGDADSGQSQWIDSIRLSDEVKYSGSTYTVPTSEFSLVALGSAAITEGVDSASATGTAWYPGFGGAGTVSLTGSGLLERRLVGSGDLILSATMEPAQQGFVGSVELSLSGSGAMVRPDPLSFGAQWIWTDIVAIPDNKTRIDARFSYQEIKVEPSP